MFYPNPLTIQLEDLTETEIVTVYLYIKKIKIHFSHRGLFLNSLITVIEIVNGVLQFMNLFSACYLMTSHSYN